MAGFFKMSNRVFDYKLSPKAFVVYAYMCNKSNRFDCLIAKCEDIAVACNLCRQSVMSAIAELERVNLVIKNNRYNALGYKASSFSVKTLLEKKGWFRIERELFNTNINPADFLVYAFIKKCMFNSTSEAFPSLSYIAEGAGLSHRRVCTAVKYLRQYTFLNRIRRLKRNLTFNRNRYLHYRLKNKRHAISNLRTFKIISRANHNTQIDYNYMLQHLCAKCNIFSTFGVVHNFNNSS